MNYEELRRHLLLGQPPEDAVPSPVLPPDVEEVPLAGPYARIPAYRPRFAGEPMPASAGQGQPLPIPPPPPAPSREVLIGALRNAHNANDTEAATRIAAMIPPAATQIYQVQTPDGAIIKVEGPAGASDSEVLAQAQALHAKDAQQAPVAAPQKAPERQEAPPRQWSDVPIEAIGNIPASAGRFFGGLYDAVTSPKETANALADLAAGAGRAGLRAVLPGLEDKGNADTQRQDEMASAAWKALKARYHGEDAIKNTLATDPVGAMADLSTLVSGGAMVAPKLGATGAAIAPKLVTAANLTDPVYLAAKGAQLAGQGAMKGSAYAGRHVLGMTTGAGSSALSEAYRTGKVGGEAGETFRGAMRGDLDQIQLLEDARAGMKKIAEDRNREYGEHLAQTSKEYPATFQFDSIMGDAQRSIDSVMYADRPLVGKAEMKVINEARNILTDWSKLSTDVHDAAGINALRKRIDAIYPGPEMRQAQRILTEIRNGLNMRVEVGDPMFATANKAYSESRNLSNQLERTLSLGRNSTDDTALRKLLSTSRNNVQTNYGVREKLLRELEEKGGVQLRPAIAGAALGSPVPRGLQANVATGLGTIGYIGSNPLIIPALMTQSPRLVGEIAHAAGRATGIPKMAAAKASQLGAAASAKARQFGAAAKASQFGAAASAKARQGLDFVAARVPDQVLRAGRDITDSARGLVRDARGNIDLIKSFRPGAANSLQAIADLEENRLREQRKRMEGK